MAGSMIGEIITDHRERMLNLKKYYPFFRLMDASFDQYKDGKYCALDMGYILMAVLRFLLRRITLRKRILHIMNILISLSCLLKEILVLNFRKKNAGKRRIMCSIR